MITFGKVRFVDPDEVDQDLDGSSDRLQANVGTHFKHLRRLQPTKDQLYASIVVKLPELPTLLMLLAQNKFQKLGGICGHLKDQNVN